MYTPINLLKKLSLVLLISLCFNCQQEDDSKVSPEGVINQTKQTSRVVSAKDIREVMDFIESKVGKELQFILDDSNSQEGQHRSHEENLTLTTAFTDHIKEVTNSYGKSNYTFRLIEEQSREGTYFLNLVVKEHKDSFYLYILKYVPNEEWLRSFIDENSLADFTGSLYIYDGDGVYIGKGDMVNGVGESINYQRCNESTSGGSNNNSGTSGNTGNSNTGDGSGSQTGDGNNNNSGDGGSTGEGGGSQPCGGI